MPTTQELREKKANIWSQMQAIMERTSNTPSGEDVAAYNKAEKELDDVCDQIDVAERFEARSASMKQVDRTGVVASGKPADDESDDKQYARVFDSFLRNGAIDMDPEDRKLLQANFQANKDIRNAAGVGTGSAGGYLVPPEFRDKIVQTMKYYGPMLQEAEVVETETGANLPWPTNDDTGNVGAILAENAQVTEQDVTLGTASIDAYMYTSKLVRASFQLLQDRPDFDTWLAERLGERIGRILNAHFTTGTGSSQPDGIVTSATSGVTVGGTFATLNANLGDALIDLIESLDPAYGGGSGLKFMMHQTVRKAVRKLKDSQGQYLWQPTVQAGVPDQLLGYPIVINNDMATNAIGSKSVGFGNIREAYVARIVRETQLLRLTERYADFLQVGFLAFKRADGTMQNTNAFKVATNAAS